MMGTGAAESSQEDGEPSRAQEDRGSPVGLTALTTFLWIQHNDLFTSQRLPLQTTEALNPQHLGQFSLIIIIIIIYFFIFLRSKSSSGSFTGKGDS